MESSKLSNEEEIEKMIRKGEIKVTYFPDAEPTPSNIESISFISFSSFDAITQVCKKVKIIRINPHDEICSVKLLEELSLIQTMQCLSLYLYGPHLSKLVKIMSKYPSLNELRIASYLNPQQPDQMPMVISILQKSFPNLKCLKLASMPRSTYQQHLQVYSIFRLKLRRLELDNIKIRVYQEIDCSIEQLVFNNCQINASCYAPIFKNCHSLKSLSLSNVYKCSSIIIRSFQVNETILNINSELQRLQIHQGDEQSFCSLISKQRGIRDLVVYHMNSRKALESIGKCLNSLKCLSLLKSKRMQQEIQENSLIELSIKKEGPILNCQLNGNLIMEIVGTFHPQLLSLTITNDSITNESLMIASKFFKCLQQIKLSYCMIQNNGGVYLSKMKSLKVIEIHNAIDENICIKIMRNLSQLEKFWFGQKTKLVRRRILKEVESLSFTRNQSFEVIYV